MTSRLRTTLGSALARHAALAGAALVLVAGVTMIGIWRYAGDEAHRTAERVSTEIAETVIVTLARYDYGPADEEHRRRVMRALEPYLDSGLVHRVKVWRLDGDLATVVVSDERRIEGTTRPVDRALARRLDAGEAVTFRVPLDDEHRYEIDRADELVEVFIGFEDVRGAPMRLELYVPVDIGGTIRHVAMSLVPLVLGALALLAVVTLPLTLALARRMQRDAERRQAVLRYGLAASDRERLELARRLHDGVIQDLAGVGLMLDTVTGPAADAARVRVLERARALVADDVRQLRAMLTELAPAGPAPDDVAGLLERIAAEVTMQTMAAVPATDAASSSAGLPPVTVDTEPGCSMDDRSATLLYHCVRELLRNAVRHSGASRIDVTAREDGGALYVAVADDGVGFERAAESAAGHLGLDLVEQALTDEGGGLTVHSSASTGTRAVVRLPRARDSMASRRPPR